MTDLTHINLSGEQTLDLIRDADIIYAQFSDGAESIFFGKELVVEIAKKQREDSTHITDRKMTGFRLNPESEEAEVEALIKCCIAIKGRCEYSGERIYQNLRPLSLSWHWKY